MVDIACEVEKCWLISGRLVFRQLMGEAMAYLLRYIDLRPSSADLMYRHPFASNAKFI